MDRRIKIKLKNSFVFFSLYCLINSIAFAQDKLMTFNDGPLIFNYGKHAIVKQDIPVDKKAHFNIAFDVGTSGGQEKVNNHFNSLARFLNMHVANGIPTNNIKLALVVHGKAGFDLLNTDAYQAQFLTNNPNSELLTQLLKNKVDIYLCGQSAAYYKIENKALHKGVKMSLSAMTTHALLQQKGYTLNPF